MKNIIKNRYISFILALLMIVGVFLPHGGALAKENEKYTIDLQIDVKDKEDYSNHNFKEKSLLISPSGRQVMVYKLNIEGDLSEDQMIELANKYDTYNVDEIGRAHV